MNRVSAGFGSEGDNSLSCSQTKILSGKMIATVLQYLVRPKAFLKSLLLYPHPGLENTALSFHFKPE